MTRSFLGHRQHAHRIDDPGRGAPFTSDRALAIDGAAVVIVGAAICLASERLAVMSILVPTVLALRFLAWSRLSAAERGLPARREVAFFALGMAIGAGNDWNSVVRHRIYDYTVPHGFPIEHAIPLWMLLYWGMILRFVAALCRWPRLGAPPRSSDTLHLGGRDCVSAPFKVAVELTLALATRQMIYAHFDHPFLSWLPFAAALAVYAVLFRPGPHERRLLAVAAVGGPVVEILFIQVGGLHHYRLGWLGGVPLWIALWWMLAVLIWNDLSARLLAWGSPSAATTILHRSANCPETQS
jgi:hypothetical protein